MPDDARPGRSDWPALTTWLDGDTGFLILDT